MTLPALGLNEDLVDIPVLVTLDATRIDYAKTQDAGQDLRFVDADGAGVLSHEIERWDETGTSYVWVKVPLVHGNAADFFWMYYGNPAAPDGQNAGDVWSGGYVMVHHLSETSGEHLDSTADHNNSSTLAVAMQGAASGKIAGADELQRASSDSIFVQPSSSLDLVDELTVSAWIAPNAVSTIQPVMGKGFTYHVWNYWLGAYSDSLAFLYSNPPGNYFEYVSPAGALQAGRWQNIAATYKATGTQGPELEIYVDGSLLQRWTGIVPVLANAEQLQVGGDTCPNYYEGFLDEVRSSRVARTAGWMHAEYVLSGESQLAFGVEESR